MTPTLSVIVPFYNVDHYLDDCLSSIAGGSLHDLEVIMVDDGSTDGSADVAVRHAASDPRFTLVRCPHRGVGPARNVGVMSASGEFLAFADSDDLIPPASYKLMVDSLQETGSDIACGAVQRFTSEEVWDSPLHKGVFADTKKATHITRTPELINDRTVWNKVYRRDFWLHRRLSFPDQLYEDAPVTIPAHYFAREVDLLSDTVYMWRRREAGDLSITQRVWEFGNIQDRLKQVLTVSRFLAANCQPLKRIYDHSALEHDLLIVLLALRRLSPDHQAEVIGTLCCYLDRVDAEVVAGVTSLRWRKCELLRRESLDRLLTGIEHLRIEDLL